MFRRIVLVTVAIGLCEATFGTRSSLLSAMSKPLVWEGGSLSFPTESAKKMFIEGGKYITKNMIATKAVYTSDTVIVMMSRLREGNPATLASYNLRNNLPEPLFTPYPDLASHEEGNCQAVQNAVDIFLDSTGLLWVLDTGNVNTLVKPKVTCSPKVVCISTRTGRIERSLDLSSLVSKSTEMQHIVADRDQRGNVYLYITDAPSNAILVYDVSKDQGFRVLLPRAVSSITKPNNVLYMTLTRRQTGDTVLYITYLNSPHIFSIKTQYLKKGKAQGKITDVGAKVAPMIFLGTDGQSKIYYRYQNEAEIFAWDTVNSFDPESSRAVFKSEDCFIPTAVIVDQRNRLKVLESTYKDYLDEKNGCGTFQQILNLA